MDCYIFLLYNIRTIKYQHNLSKIKVRFFMIYLQCFTVRYVFVLKLVIIYFNILVIFRNHIQYTRGVLNQSRIG